jgi:hypothetical protein
MRVRIVLYRHGVIIFGHCSFSMYPAVDSVQRKDSFDNSYGPAVRPCTVYAAGGKVTQTEN